uniref:Uncharacterized protein n=1 Tax=Rhizophagus irregularis (strain DAOM 181602 / DAOM 197198 / MUCL 43194) TaxID=747089 RepID=U9TKA3_RHIID
MYEPMNYQAKYYPKTASEFPDFMEETNLENFDQRLYEEFLDYARGIMIQFGINTEIEVNYYYKS